MYIDFRVWDKIGVKWLGSPVIADGHVFMDGRDYEDYIYADDRVEVSWFTGWHDCSGQKMYEGDVFEVLINHAIGVVKFGVVPNNDINGFYVQSKGLESIIALTPSKVSSNIKVIGNIYENPELMTVN